MRRRGKKIKLYYSKERVLFSDVLPYECPIIFSNRYFYRFLAKYLWIKSENNSKIILNQSKRMHESDAMIFAALLFGAYKNGTHIDKIEIKENAVFYPFKFNIAHKPTKNRTLSVIHPFNQWQVVNFYEKYKYSLLYLCNQSRFSLRKPHKVAQYFYYRDRLHKKLLGHDSDKVELFFNEYENLKTYFSYEEYSNIYKFYEDYRYQRAEKKFKHLVKFDLQSCFDSIYTHSICWATSGGCDKVKVLQSFKGSWVGDAFDQLMQAVNARETNGIVIGPEFSRIFAEIILQYIDRKVELDIYKSNGLQHKSNYECYRYVDDYFLFYNDEKDKIIIMESFTKWLKEFKLQISPSKTEEYERPFLTNVTRAKQRVDELLNSLFSKEIWEDKISIENQVDDNDETEIDLNILDTKVNLYFSANKLNSYIKDIIVECEIKYSDIANYLLEKLSMRLDGFLNRYELGFKKLERIYICSDIDKEKKEEALSLAIKIQKKMTAFLVSLIDVTFFVFNSNRQVNTTVKLQKLVNTIILYAKRHGDFITCPEVRFETISKDAIFKKVQDEIALVLSTTDEHRNTLHESLYLLILAKELGNSYLYSSDFIDKFITKSEHQYNLFACIILLYYYSNHKCYLESKSKLLKEIEKRYKEFAQSERLRNSELTIMAADLMTCPFVDNKFKIRILKEIGITEKKDHESILRFAKKQKYIFTRWTSFNLNKELQAKVSQEVYS